MATPRPESHARHNLVQPTMRVTLERQGSGTHEIRIDQVTTENLRRLFQVYVHIANIPTLGTTSRDESGAFALAAAWCIRSFWLFSLIFLFIIDQSSIL